MFNDDDKFDVYRDLQLISLENFIHPDEDSFYRRLCRWFATEFHTSLFEVEKKSLEYLLMHYFEYKLEKMLPDEFQKYKRFLLYKEEVLTEEDEDEAFAEAMEAEFIKKKQAELTAKKAKETKPKDPLPELPPDINITFG